MPELVLGGVARLCITCDKPELNYYIQRRRWSDDPSEEHTDQSPEDALDNALGCRLSGFAPSLSWLNRGFPGPIATLHPEALLSTGPKVSYWLSPSPRPGEGQLCYSSLASSPRTVIRDTGRVFACAQDEEGR